MLTVWHRDQSYTIWNILFMAPRIKLIVVFTYFGAVSLKRMRRFDLLTTYLGHALVVCDLTQIPAEGSGCRWGAASIPDHDSLWGRYTPQGQDSLGEQMWNCIISHHL